MLRKRIFSLPIFKKFLPIPPSSTLPLLGRLLPRKYDYTIMVCTNLYANLSEIRTTIRNETG